MQFGEFIKQQRVKQSIGRSRLGQMVDRSAATIARWERVEAFPVDDDVLVALGDALGVEIAELETVLRESRKAAVAESASEESAAPVAAGQPEPAESAPAEPRTGINLAAAVGGATAAEEVPSSEEEITVPEDTVVPDAVEAAIFGLTTAEQPAVETPEDLSDAEDEPEATEEEAEASEPDFVADPFADAPTGESEVAAVAGLAVAGVSEDEAAAVLESEALDSVADEDLVGVDETAREDPTEPADEEATAGGDEGTSDFTTKDEEEIAEATAVDDFFGLLVGTGEEEPGPDETPSAGAAEVAATATAAAAIADTGPDTVESAPPTSARSVVSRGQRRPPPTEVAYDTLGPVSYTESRRQMRTYRIRTVLVVAIMVVLGMLFLWAMAELWEAIGDAWQSF